MAETYHILDWRELPIKLTATLACGLDADSRTKRWMAGEVQKIGLVMQAAMLDQLQMIRWYQTEDGRKGRNPPKLMTEMMQPKKKGKKQAKAISGEAFDSRWREITGGNRKWQKTQ